MQQRIVTFGGAPALLMLLAASVAVAQTEKPRLELESADLYSCRTAGTAPHTIKICVSQNGNLVRLEAPAGTNHMFSEGYLVCYQPAGQPLKKAFSGLTESGWGPVILPPPAGTFPLTLRRRTTDGVLELTQVISWDAIKKDVVIEMRLKNLTGSFVNAQILRFFDADVGGDANDDIFDRTALSVTARDTMGAALPVYARGVMASALSDAPTPVINSYSDWISGGQNNCGYQPPAGRTSPTAAGDWVGRLEHLNFGGLTAGRTETFKLIYRAY